MASSEPRDYVFASRSVYPKALGGIKVDYDTSARHVGRQRALSRSVEERLN
jgi:hypothetical protein